jgi:hypothetical protein
VVSSAENNKIRRNLEKTLLSSPQLDSATAYDPGYTKKISQFISKLEKRRRGDQAILLQIFFRARSPKKFPLLSFTQIRH